MRKREMAHLALFEITSASRSVSMLGNHNEIYDFLTDKRVYL